MFTPHADLSLRVEHIGAERAPVLIAENLIAETDMLIEAAARAIFIDIGPVYPGVRGPAPQPYADAVLRILGPEIEHAFGARAPMDFDICAFSMVTHARAGLDVSQRLPHYDGVEPYRFALMHYVCRPGFGGTSFYRHRGTGYEVLSAARHDAYRKALRADILKHGAPAQDYILGDTPIFERIASYDAVFNRAILYRGASLHSGDIRPDDPIVEDFQHGRLTISGFGMLG